MSNADLVLTLEKMLGPAVVGDEAIAAVKRLRPTTPCFLTHIGLRDMPIAPLHDAAGYHWRSWDANQVRDDAFKIFIPDDVRTADGAAGGQIIILQRLDADYETVTDWQAHKYVVEQDLMQRLEAALPGVGGHIVTCQSASALTSWRYTLNYRGAMLGWEMSPDQLARRGRRWRDRSATSISPVTGRGRAEALRRSSCRRWMWRVRLLESRADVGLVFRDTSPMTHASRRR